MIDPHESKDLKRLSVSLKSFIDGALLGEMHLTPDDVEDDGGYESKLEVVGSGQTPISNGLSERFSTSDIAYFYIARELGPSWLNHLIVGYKSFCEDVRFEEKYAGPEMFCCNNIKKGE